MKFSIFLLMKQQDHKNLVRRATKCKLFIYQARRLRIYYLLSKISSENLAYQESRTLEVFVFIEQE